MPAAAYRPMNLAHMIAPMMKQKVTIMSERWPNDSDKLGIAEWRCEECGTINSTDFLTCDDCGYSQDGVPPEDDAVFPGPIV
jgi:rubrerythrin